MIVPPCKDCADRVLGCHAGCEKYHAFREEVNAFNREQHRQHRRFVQANQTMWDAYIRDGAKRRRNK